MNALKERGSGGKRRRFTERTTGGSDLEEEAEGGGGGFDAIDGGNVATRLGNGESDLDPIHAAGIAVKNAMNQSM